MNCHLIAHRGLRKWLLFFLYKILIIDSQIRLSCSNAMAYENIQWTTNAENLLFNINDHGKWTTHERKICREMIKKRHANGCKHMSPINLFYILECRKCVVAKQLNEQLNITCIRSMADHIPINLHYNTCMRALNFVRRKSNSQTAKFDTNSNSFHKQKLITVIWYVD